MGITKIYTVYVIYIFFSLSHLFIIKFSHVLQNNGGKKDWLCYLCFN